MKKILSLILVMCMMLSVCAVPALAENAARMGEVKANNAIEITVDGKAVDCASYGQLPVIVEGRTLVPLRAVFEALGATVEWNNETRTVVSQRGDIKISLSVDSDQLYINGVAKTIDVPAQIMNDRTMVPVRAIVEAFGCTVYWDNTARRVVIVTVSGDEAENELVYDEETKTVAQSAEEAVVNMWNCLAAGDFEGMKNYIAEDVDVAGITDIRTMVQDALVGEMDMSQYSPEQSERITDVTVKLVNTMFGVMSMKIVKTEVIAENAVSVQVVIGMPDMESMDMEAAMGEEAIMAIMLEAAANMGYSLEDIAELSYEEQELLSFEMVIAMIDYLCDVLGESAATLPVVEGEPVELYVKLIDGKWLVAE